MVKEYLQIGGIPAVIWNKEAKKIVLAVHGLMSNKEDTVIKILAKEATSKNYAVICFDMPLHGERKNDINYLLTVKNCQSDIKKVYSYIKPLYNDISLFCNSMAAYYSMQVLYDENITKSFFLSPIVDMLFLTNSMLEYEHVTLEDLKKEKSVTLKNGTYVDLDSYEYLSTHSVCWKIPTYILYGEKDFMMPKSIIESFVKKTNSSFTIYPKGEHFFYGDEPLNFFSKWLNQIL